MMWEKRLGLRAAFSVLARLNNPHAQHVVEFFKVMPEHAVELRWCSHEFGEMSPPLVADNRIQVISLPGTVKRHLHELAV